MEKREKILVVDDSFINRRVLSKILLQKYDVVEAENGKHALELLEQNLDGISAVLLDLIMPVMNGYEVLNIMKSDNRYHNIPVLVTTGENDKESEKNTLKLGAWDFISKPYDAGLIQVRLQNAIARSQLTAFARLKYLSEYDVLTGIFNRNNFFKETKKMLLDNPEKQFIFVRGDIDRFQLINSFYGMEEGDKLLKYIARNLEEFGNEMKLCTYGRIEADIFGFCIEYQGIEYTKELIEKQKKIIADYNSNFDILPSYGIYLITDDTIPVDIMYDRASLAARQCKGKYNQIYAMYEEKMSASLIKEQIITNEMKAALSGGQFEVFLQPKYNLQNNAISGAEALVRWRHPEKGMISPGDFIPVFERNGFITTLDYFVWESVCKKINQWLREGKKVYPISVNVSRVNLYNPRFIEILTELVEKYRVPYEFFELELTESAYMDNPVAMTETMRILQEKGFIILMDDFGSGYSSLNILKDIAVNILKIDMKFLSETKIPGRGENIIASVVRMAKWLSIPAIAEGVETKEQTEFLRGIGCEYVQGYYFGKPMPISQYEELVDSSEVFQEKMEEKINFNADTIWESNSQMEKMFGSLMQATAVYEYEPGRVETLRVNNAFYDLFGFDDIVGSKDTFRMVSVDDKKKILKAFENAVRSKKNAECEFLRNMPNSPNKWISLRLKYINKIGGKEVLFGSLSDITAQKELDLELQKFKNALENARGESHRILIVDDMEMNREILKNIFEESYIVLEAEHGKEAFEVLKEQEYDIDVILLDLMMPVMDGEEFMRAKMANPKTVDIPVIIITSDDTTEQQVKSLSLGASDYVVKPFVREIVERRVRNVIESHKRYQEILRDYHSVVEQSQLDHLTGIYNRSATQGLIERVLISGKNQINALIVMDIDNFKEINDARGHLFGDKVLCAVAEVLENFFRKDDIAGRIGGDEFCIFMRNVPSKQLVYQKAYRLCQEISKKVEEKLNTEASCSVGVAITSTNEKNSRKYTFERLYKEADEALYEAKKAGKNQFRIYLKNDDTAFVPSKWSVNEELMDELENAVFVFDFDTDELLYASKHAREKLKLRDAYEGKKCYEIWYDRKEPCPDCIKGKLQEESYQKMEIESICSNQKMKVRDKIIMWCGKKTHVQIVED